MRLRKLALSCLFAGVTATEAIGIGWSVANGDIDSFVIFALRLAFSLYLLLLSFASINQHSIQDHSKSILHILVLSFLATTLMGETAIFPLTPPPIASSMGSSSALNVPWYTSLVFYFLACVVAITTPQGPKYHYPPEQIYLKKTVSAISTVYEDNVCGSTSTLLRAYTYVPHSMKYVFRRFPL